MQKMMKQLKRKQMMKHLKNAYLSQQMMKHLKNAYLSQHNDMIELHRE